MDNVLGMLKKFQHPIIMADKGKYYFRFSMHEAHIYPTIFLYSFGWFGFPWPAGLRRVSIDH
jgi:hypothetical protein